MLFKLNGVTKDNVIIPRRLIKIGAATVAMSYILLPLVGYLVTNNKISYYWVPVVAGVSFICVAYLLKISWVYIFGKKALEYKGLSDREKELREQNLWLKEEREILKKFAGFQNKALPKILLSIVTLLWIGSVLVIIMLIVEHRFLEVTPARLAFYMTITFAAISLLIYAYMYIVFGRKSVEFCLNCDRIKVGESWRHLTKFGNFSHSLCDTCAEAMAHKHMRKAGDKLGTLLVKKGIINTLQLKKALDTQKKLREKDIGTILQEMGAADEDTISKALNEQLYLMENGNGKEVH